MFQITKLKYEYIFLTEYIFFFFGRNKKGHTYLNKPAAFTCRFV